MKKQSGSSRQEEQTVVSGKHIYDVTPKMQAEIDRLKEMPESSIQADSDIPEDLSILGDPIRGKFYRPIKKPVTIRLDMDVIAWFKAQPGKYQSNINKILREYVIQHGTKDGI